MWIREAALSHRKRRSSMPQMSIMERPNQIEVDQKLQQCAEKIGPKQSARMNDSSRVPETMEI